MCHFFVLPQIGTPYSYWSLNFCSGTHEGYLCRQSIYMAACHKPETMVKLKSIYKDFADQKSRINYLTMDGPEGTLTIVNVPFYDGAALGGVVEMVFEGSLA